MAHFVCQFPVSFYHFFFSGWINGAGAIDSKSEAVGAMFFICGALWTLLAICKILLLRKVSRVYIERIHNEAYIVSVQPPRGESFARKEKREILGIYFSY